MDEAKAKSNLCTIFYRKDDGTKSFLGCGCLIKYSEQKLKVATCGMISSSKSEIIAKFEAQGEEIKLYLDTEEKSLANNGEGIVYMSFDVTEKQLPDGLFKADPEDVDDGIVPVLENMEQFGGKNGFSFYKVVKDGETFSLQNEVGSNKRSFDRRSELHKNHLEVLGSPILTEDYKFLGIMDFPELEGCNESFLRINYWDGIRKNSIKGGSNPTQPQGRVVAQETIYGGNKLSPANPLRDLWKYIDFSDELSKVLDVKYSEIKYWPHLAEKFGIDKIIYEAFSTSDINSPTETLLEHLESTEPDFNIKELCEALHLDETREVCRIVKKSVEVGDLCEEDLVTDICDKAPNVLDTIILKLDREDRLWKALARAKKIPSQLSLSFKSDRTDNRTRLLFDALAAEAPGLLMKNFKDKLIKLDRNNLVKILNEYKISDEIPLRDLSKHPDAKGKIETILNDPKTDCLWMLASLYQKEGLLADIKIETRFRSKQDCHSPTRKMMEYVLASSSKEYTIEDLIIKLTNIKRGDCLVIIEPYLKGGKQDIDRIIQGIKEPQLEPPSHLPEVSNEEHNGVAATDNAKNPYLEVNMKSKCA